MSLLAITELGFGRAICWKMQAILRYNLFKCHGTNGGAEPQRCRRLIMAIKVPTSGLGLDSHGLDDESLRRFLRTMMLIRRFEERAAEMYLRAKIAGYLHLNIGEEASVVGIVAGLRDSDYIFDGYRDHGYVLARGTDPKLVMAELFGRVGGLVRGRGGSMHLFDPDKRFMGGYAIVGGSMPLAVGAALALKYQGRTEIVANVFGDGSTNIGAFHESLNVAALWKLPVVFIIVNNQYGMGTAVARASAVKELYRKASAYDMPSAQVDGMDLLTVIRAVKEAAERARNENIPTLLELITYRYRGHSMADPGRYRTEEELRAWMERDPIERYKSQLISAGLVDQVAVEAYEAEVQQEVDDAVQFADASPEPGPEELLKYVYGEP